MEGDGHEAAVVEEAGAVPQLFAPPERCLKDGELVFVAESYDLICLFGFGYLSEVIERLVVIELAHLTLVVPGARIKKEVTKGSIVVAAVTEYDAAVLRCTLAYD